MTRSKRLFQFRLQRSSEPPGLREHLLATFEAREGIILDEAALRPDLHICYLVVFFLCLQTSDLLTSSHGLDTILKILFVLAPWALGAIIYGRPCYYLHFRGKKLRKRRVKSFDQGLTAWKWQSWESIQGSLSLMVMVLLSTGRDRTFPEQVAAKDPLRPSF